MKRLFFILMISILGFGTVLEAQPAYQGTTPSLFFTDSTRKVIPITASPGARLPVDAGTFSAEISSLSFSVPENGRTFDLIANSIPASITASPDRVSFALFNLGTQTIWLAFGETTATVSKGIPLPPDGMVGLQSIGPGLSIWYVASSPTAFTYAEVRK